MASIDRAHHGEDTDDLLGDIGRWFLTRLAVYLAVAVVSGGLFIAGSAIYAQFAAGAG